MRQEAQETRGSLDAPDDDGAVPGTPVTGETVTATSAASGHHLTTTEEQEQEQLDSLKIDGFPKSD